MRIMVIGDDAVAHAAVEKLAQGAEVYAIMERLNPGIAKRAKRAYACEFSNIEVVGSWVIKENCDLIVILSEDALHNGLTDTLVESGFLVASPSLAAASIGNNRVYARTVVKKYNFFPRYSVCKTIQEVKKAIEEYRYSVLKSVVRTDWKGTKFEDLKSKKEGSILTDAKKLLKEHSSVIVEEYVEGEEFTLHAFCDGKKIAILTPVQVAKYAQDGDTGENTEGMASYSTGKNLPFITNEELLKAKQMLQTIITILAQRGTPYKGVIQARYMISSKALKLLDVRSSFGNPDGINCITLIASDLAQTLKSVADGALYEPMVRTDASVVKYAVPLDYPNGKKKNKELFISGKHIDDATYYVEHLRKKNNKLFLTNNRAVAVVSSKESIEEANEAVDAALALCMGEVRWRKDVATKQYIDKHIKRAEALRKTFLYMQPVKGSR